MRQCSILVLPYPEGDFFAARFPIKAMEYAAVGRSVLCTQTVSHTNIFTEDEAWFYSLSFSGDLIKKMKMIFANEFEANKKIKNAYEKSLSFSYSSRVSRVIDFLQ
jgi:glycosyltransferase involved in cell wall biosynthesis